MTLRINGSGMALPTPANLYPSYLTATPYDAPMNLVGLAPRDAIYFPATSNDFICNVGALTVDSVAGSSYWNLA